jgi:hypothetical protein
MIRATRITVSVFGTLMGFAGIEHGVGEILQGSRPPEGLIFPSWPNAPFFTPVSGEPALSILPDLLLTGILAVIFSLAYICCATLLIGRRKNAVIMLLLSVAMLLTGGGIFPPVLGMFIAGLAARVDPRRPMNQTGWFESLRDPAFFSWRIALLGSLICWFLLCPGINLLYISGGIENSGLTMVIVSAALASLALVILLGIQADKRMDSPMAASKLAADPY